MNSRILNIICVFQMLEMFSRHDINPRRNPFLYFEVIVQVSGPFFANNSRSHWGSKNAKNFVRVNLTWHCFCKCGVLLRSSLKMQMWLNFSKTIPHNIIWHRCFIAVYCRICRLVTLCWVRTIIIFTPFRNCL